MGRPKRSTPPKCGVITRQRVNNVESSLRKLELTEAFQCAPASRSPTAHTENRGTPQVTKQTHVSFEVKTSSSALPAELAELYASIAPLPVQPFDDTSDENNPPLVHLSKERAPGLDVFDEVVIPEPRLRMKREPFGVLYYAEAGSDAKATTTIVEPENRAIIKSTFDGVSSPCSLEGEGGRLKGLMRLRAKAPPPIDMTLVKTAIELEKSFISKTIYDSTISTDSTASASVEQVKMEDASTIPSAPMMLNVPLPPITPIEKGSRVITIPALTLSIPIIRRPRLPLTPKRQALLDILIGDSLFDNGKSVSERKEI